MALAGFQEGAGGGNRFDTRASGLTRHEFAQGSAGRRVQQGWKSSCRRWSRSRKGTTPSGSVQILRCPCGQEFAEFSLAELSYDLSGSPESAGFESVAANRVPDRFQDSREHRVKKRGSHGAPIVELGAIVNPLPRLGTANLGRGSVFHQVVD